LLGRSRVGGGKRLSEDKTPHIAFVGCGAVGGYTAGHLARSGVNVTFIDPWVEHIEAIRAHGVRLTGTQGDHSIMVRALHVSDVQSLTRSPVDIAIIATKSFDTRWAARLIRDYLAPDGYVVSMQNSINEPHISCAVGPGRTVGCVLNTIGVSTLGPGHLSRFRTPGGSKHAVFGLGELHGRITPRIRELAALLGRVDTAAVTTNLWGERWSKLVTNAMQMGLLGATGLVNEEVLADPELRGILVRAAAEGIRVAQAHGYDVEPVVSTPSETWLAAADGSAVDRKTIDGALLSYLDRQTTDGRRGHGSLGRDVLSGRRSEIDYINGLIASEGQAKSVPTPVHDALTSIVRRIERGEASPSREHILPLIAR